MRLEGVTAARACAIIQGRKFPPARRANWNKGEPRQRRAAKSARSRKEDATQTIQRTSEYANHGAPPDGFRRRNDGRAGSTDLMEDAPRFGAKLEDAARCAQYSARRIFRSSVAFALNHSEKGNQPDERQRAAAKSRSIPRCPLFRLSGYGRHLRLSAEGVGNTNPAPQSVWVS